MRVLYVEDNPANVFLVKRVARMGNHEIINLIDGQQALRKFDDIQPDIVLMDIQLSGEMGGLDVVRKLRERGVTTPIIAVTAYAMVGDKERCLEAGCDEYMAKPLPVPRLVEIFESHSKRVAAAAESEPDTEATPSAAPNSPEADDTDSAAAEKPVTAASDTDISTDAIDPAQTESATAVATDSVMSAPDGSATPATQTDETPVSDTTADTPAPDSTETVTDTSDSHETDSETDNDSDDTTPTVTESTGQPDIQSGN